MCHSIELVCQTWFVLKFWLLLGLLIKFWTHLVVWMQIPIGYALDLELLQLGLSSTNCTLDWSEALPFYLCSATLTWCFWCDGTKRTLSQVLKLWWLVWMYQVLSFFSVGHSLLFCCFCHRGIFLFTLALFCFVFVNITTLFLCLLRMCNNDLLLFNLFHILVFKGLSPLYVLHFYF